MLTYVFIRMRGKTLGISNNVKLKQTHFNLLLFSKKKKTKINNKKLQKKGIRNASPQKVLKGRKKKNIQKQLCGFFQRFLNAEF